MQIIFTTPHSPVNPDYHYTTGTLLQQCSCCDWIDKNLKIEVEHCPKCAAAVAKDCVLYFGGTTLSFLSRKGKFEVSSPYGGENVIYEADFKDAMVFMLRHATIWEQ
jgi:hypothetical protein